MNVLQEFLVGLQTLELDFIHIPGLVLLLVVVLELLFSGISSRTPTAIILDTEWKWRFTVSDHMTLLVLFGGGHVGIELN